MFGPAFADPKAGNLHLKKSVPEVVDQAPKLAEVTEDIDGAKRGSKPDLGADEI